MAEVKKKDGVEISKEGQHLKITVPSYSTMIIVYPEDKKHFIKYLKCVHKKYNIDKSRYISDSSFLYGKDRIYLGKSLSVKYPRFGNYLEIKKIPIILDLLNCNVDGETSIVSIIRKIKKIRGRK